MDQLTAIRTFHRVVDEGSFAAAARTLGITRSVVNKRIKHLEEEMGVALLSRSTRNVSVTDAGQRFYEQSTPLVAGLDEAIASAAEASADPSGTVRVNAPMSYGQKRIAPNVARFMQAYPDVRVELALNDRIVDPIEEGFDVTVRVGREEHFTSLDQIRIGQSVRHLVAAPAYLEQHGTPEVPADLRQHRCLHYGYQQTGSAWPVQTAGGEQSVAVNCVFWSNNGDVLAQTAADGLGIALLPDFIVENAVESGQLEVISSHLAPPPLGVYALFPRSRYVPRRVRALLEALSTGL